MQLNQEVNYDHQYEQDFQANSPKVETKQISMQTPQNVHIKKTQTKDLDQSYEQDFQKTEVQPISHDPIKQSPHKAKINQESQSASRILQRDSKAQEEVNNNSSQLKLAKDLNDPNRQKMIEQNIKLKTQIYELAKQMDDIMAKEKKNKKYGINADQQDDQVLKVKKQQLKKQQVQILNLKNKIFITKRQLEHVYDSRGIQGKQDQLKNLQQQLKVLQQEKSALNKVKKQQSKALKIIRNDNEYENKIGSLKQSILKMKQQCRYLSENLVENERVLRKNHETYLTKQAKIKQMQQKIKQSKEKSKHKSKAKKEEVVQNVTPQMVTELQKQIHEIEQQKKETERSWNEKIAGIQSELQQKRLQEQKKLLILKDKQKQLRLSQLRVKQLKKLISHHQKEISKSKTGIKDQAKQIDSREFRHKRNIKHL